MSVFLSVRTSGQNKSESRFGVDKGLQQGLLVPVNVPISLFMVRTFALYLLIEYGNRNISSTYI
jgi:hypothetical protein